MVHLLWISVPAEDFPVFRWLYSFRKYNSIWLTVSEKRSRVGQAVAEAIGLKNVTFRHCRAEEEKQLFDFVVSRAVMPLGDLVKISRKNVKKEQQNALPNGLICLKGGELQHEIQAFQKQAIVVELGDHFKEEFFQTKKVVYVPL